MFLVGKNQKIELQEYKIKKLEDDIQDIKDKNKNENKKFLKDIGATKQGKSHISTDGISRNPDAISFYDKYIN